MILLQQYEVAVYNFSRTEDVSGSEIDRLFDRAVVSLTIVNI